jgi:hypothetical protein
MLFKQANSCGYRPESWLDLEGRHIGDGHTAFLNTVPRAAIRSTFGVLAHSDP